MRSSLSVRCQAWLDSVRCGETRLTADALWLAEIDDQAPPREPSCRELLPPTPVPV